MSKKITKQSEVKPATTKKERPTKVVKTVDAKPADDEAKYLEELKRDAEEERAEQEAFKAKELAAIRQLGAAIKENVEKKVEPVSVPVVEKKIEEEVKEPVVELATSHPDMCDPNIFGTYDPSNKTCTKECAEFSPECANACKALMESKLVKRKAPKANRVPKTKVAGDSNRGMRGNYRNLKVHLSQVGRIGSFGRAIAEKLATSGLTEAEYIAIATEHSANTKRFKEYAKYYQKEGYNIVTEGGKLVDKTVY